MRLFSEDKTVWPQGLFSSTVPLSTEQKTIYCIYSFLFFLLSLLSRWGFERKHFWSVGMKSAKSLGPGCDFYSQYVAFRWRFDCWRKHGRLGVKAEVTVLQGIFIWMQNINSRNRLSLNHSAVIFLEKNNMIFKCQSNVHFPALALQVKWWITWKTSFIFILLFFYHTSIL